MVEHKLTRRDFLKRSLGGAATFSTLAFAKKSQPDSIPQKLNPNTRELLQELLEPVKEGVVSSIRIQGINFKIYYQNSRLILKTTILEKDYPRLTRALFETPRSPSYLQSYSIEYTFSVPISGDKVSNNIYLEKAKPVMSERVRQKEFTNNIYLKKAKLKRGGSALEIIMLGILGVGGILLPFAILGEVVRRDPLRDFYEEPDI